MTDTKPAKIADLEQSAKSGSPDALYALGLAYKTGDGVGQDYGKAIQYWKQAAHLRKAEALVELGKLFYYGEGVAQDFDFAFNCWNDAATLGNVDAMFLLAELYMDGYQDGADSDETFKWLTKAAAGGHPDAAYFLALGYKTGEWGMPVDATQAAKWGKEAAAKSHLDSIVEKAKAYANGTGVHQNLPRAVRWWQVAAEAGDAHALYELGKAYWFGEGVKKDVGKAKRYMLLSSRKGDVEAMNAYGFILMDDCNPTVQRQAIPYFERAAEKGFVGALLNLGALYYHGNVVKADDDKAYRYFEEAAEKGNDDERQIADTFIAFHQFDDSLPDDSEEEDKAFLKNEGEKEILVNIPFVPDISQLFAERHGLMTVGERSTDVTGEYALGLGYEMGIQGFERNDEEAAFWYKKAAVKHHDAHAQAALGRFYMKGRGGLKKDVAKALHLYADAVRGGDESAMMHLGDLYSAGKVLPKKTRYAYALYDAALNSEDSVPQAQDNIDEMLMDLSKKDRKKILEKKVPLSKVLEAVDKTADELAEKQRRKAVKMMAQ